MIGSFGTQKVKVVSGTTVPSHNLAFRLVQKTSRALATALIAVTALAGSTLIPQKSAAQEYEEGWLNQNYFDAPKTTFSMEILANAERNHFGQGNFWSKYKAGDLDRALGDLKYILLVFPNHPRALHMMTLICKTQKDAMTPIMYFEKAVRLFPDVAYTQAQYGAYLLSTGETSAAMSRINEALRIDPTMPYALALLSEAQSKQKNVVNPSAPASPSAPPASAAPGPASSASPPSAPTGLTPKSH